MLFLDQVRATFADPATQNFELRLFYSVISDNGRENETQTLASV
jgi:hypothetical protein